MGLYNITDNPGGSYNFFVIQFEVYTKPLSFYADTFSKMML